MIVDPLIKDLDGQSVLKLDYDTDHILLHKYFLEPNINNITISLL